MKVLTYTSYKEHCKLYTESHGLIAVNSCQIELVQKDIILLSNFSVIFYRANRCTGVEKFVKFSISAGTYSIDDFNTKIKIAVLQERQDWIPPQIKDLKLVIPEPYIFIAFSILFIALGVLEKHFGKTAQIKSTLPPGSYKTSLDTSPPPILLSLHCKKINKVQNELDGQPFSLIALMHVSNYRATFSSMHLVFLEFDTHLPHLDFKLLDEITTKAP